MCEIPPFDGPYMNVGDYKPTPKIDRPKKADNKKINKDFLRHRSSYAESLGYKKQKWVCFCESMLDEGYELTLYEAKQTVSKYVTVKHNGISLKVRFSNHKPIFSREVKKDCDIFVGVSNLGTTTTEQAIDAVNKFFKGKV